MGQVLMVGINEKLDSMIKGIKQEIEIKKLELDMTLDDIINDLIDNNLDPDVIVCGNYLKDAKIPELAQIFRQTLPDKRICALMDVGSVYSREELVKFGADEFYLLPLDLTRAVKYINTKASNDSEEKNYNAVKLVDINPGDVIDFDVYLFFPLNQKYIRFLSKGDVIDEKRYARMQDKNVVTIFLPEAQKIDFAKYTAKRLKDLRTDESFGSATEREERLQESVRELVLDMFDFSGGSPYEAGRKKFETVKTVVDTFITDEVGDDFFSKLSGVSSEAGDIYSHSSRVGAYAALFSVAVNIGNPQDLYMAGLFHDIGLAELPAEIGQKPEEELTKQELDVYKMHPFIAVRVLKSNKMNFTNNVYDLIENHHEYADGTGFPKGLKGANVPLESQLLTIADMFDEWTKIEPGRPRLSPEEAIKKIIESKKVSANLILRLELLLKKKAS